MKKTPVTFLIGALLMVTVTRAQNIQDGVNDLYAERYKGARATFEKLLAANPNNIDATYWLGQTLIASGDVAAARDVYSKALMASANAPLLIVGMGHVELIENKSSEANQRFEAAITMTRGKKGDDPVILNAIGRAIVNTYTEKDKKGDINYALQKLELASQRDPKNAEIFLNLGNAYRKAKPGEGGGKAFESYKKANEANPNFAPPYHRLAKLFVTQRNRDLYEQYLNDAISKDPRFAPAYEDLYYLRLGKKDFSGAQDMAAKIIANSDPDPQADHWKAQTFWAEGKYDEAINLSKAIIANAGAQTKPRTYILLADAYLSKKDSAAGKPYIDEYFTRAKPEDITAIHYRIKADIYSAIPGQEDVVLSSYQDGIKTDTVLENKIDLAKKAGDFFKAKKQYDKETVFRQITLDIKPNPTLTDLFNATAAYYFATKYAQSRDLAQKMIEKAPTEPYGHEWKFNNSLVLDTVKKDSIAVPDALALFTFSQTDSVKHKRLYMKAAGFLVNYYANDAKDRDKALEYVSRMIAMDPANEQLKGIQQQLQAPPPRQNTPPRKSGAQGSKLKNKTTNSA